ncbi:hydrolase [Corallibacter sp.]|uniref:hydrolase n=1 Tax=Corallibacter sp. TaxID=2038084 RepID=UPI003A924E0A
MKNRIFMYLFIFSLLLVLFQYVNSKHILEDYEKKLDRKVLREEKYADTINQLRDKILVASEFSIENSEQAMTFYENKGYRIDELVPFIKDQMYDLNTVKGDEHPLIPYAAMSGNGGRMLIDHIRLLNHEWIIANFSDGKYWGELLVKYELTDDKQLKFNVLDSFLYPTN